MDQPKRLYGYLPTLDGWRAISIALVVFHHTQVHFTMPYLGSALNAISMYGGSGVGVFFAISGILICSRLLDEEETHGQISLRKFYIRRAFRIVPPAWLFLLVLTALAATLGLSKLGLLSGFLFFRNYLFHAPWIDWYTGHFWSLSLEEHFYLILPGILLFFRRSRGRILAGLIVFVVFWRFWTAHHGGAELGPRTETSLDALLIPALFAIVAKSERYGPWLRRLLKPWVGLVLAIVYVVTLVHHTRLVEALWNTVLPLVVLSTCWNAGNFFGRFLESAPLRFIGKMSYSIYLWQQLFVVLWDIPLPLKWLQHWPWNYVAVAVCSSASYYLLERPMIRLGHKFANSGVPGRAGDEPIDTASATVSSPQAG